MSYQDDRPMFQVDIECGQCGKKISELPFEPSGDRPVYCSDCLKERRGNRDNRGERRMFTVDINCADCGAHISQLPFEPRGDSPIYCFECNKKRRG